MSNKIYFVRARGKVSGPYDLKKLKYLRERGQLARFHEISDDRHIWTQAGANEELFQSDPPIMPANAPVADWRYADRQGQQFGPVPPETIEQMWAEGTLDDSTLVWREDMPAWAPLSSRPAGLMLRRRTKPGNPYLNWITASAAAVMIGGCVLAAAIWFAGKKQGEVAAVKPDGTGKPLPAQVIENVMDENQMSQAVGLVVCGTHIVFPDGAVSEDQDSTGTCFSISPSGYLVTNEHVVRETHKLNNAKLLLKKWQDEELTVVTPQVWVFFQKAKYIAEIVYVSKEHDFAILKINRQGGPYFKLAANDAHPRGKKVIACGFPGVANAPLSDEEILLRLSRDSLNKKTPTRIESHVTSRDLDYTLTDGTLSRITTEEGTGRTWIQHTASINPGNSGGPLLSEQGIVLGLNTLYLKGASAINYSLPISQVKGDIVNHVPNAIWAK